MTQRLTPEREAEIRARWANVEPAETTEGEWGEELVDCRVADVKVYANAKVDVDALLCEIDGLRAELAGAEERGRKLEREAAVTFLRSLNYEHVPSMLERGDHVRTGTVAEEET